MFIHKFRGHNATYHLIAPVRLHVHSIILIYCTYKAINLLQRHLVSYHLDTSAYTVNLKSPPTSSFIYSIYFNSSIWILQLSIRKLSYFLTAPSQLLAFYYSRRAAEVTQINYFRSKLIAANISSPCSFLFFLHYQHINCYNKLHRCFKILFFDREEK